LGWKKLDQGGKGLERDKVWVAKRSREGSSILEQNSRKNRKTEEFERKGGENGKEERKGGFKTFKTFQRRQHE